GQTLRYDRRRQPDREARAVMSPAIHDADPAEATGSGLSALSAIPLRLLDQLPGAVLLLDGEGRIGYLNNIAELRLDTVSAALLGRDLFREIIPQLEVEGWGERYRAGMLSGRVALACDAAWGEGRLSLGIRSFIYGGVLGAF